MTKLHDLLKQHKISGKELAQAIGATQQTVSKLVTGKIRISPEWAQKIAPVFHMTPEALLFDQAGMVKLPPRLIPIRGETAAGRWFEHDELDQGRMPGVPLCPGPFENNEQFAFRVVGASMDRKRIFDGDFVICVSYWEARSSLQSGDIVVVERREGAKIERTVKEIEINGQGYELWPRSSDPRWQTPIRVPHMNDPHASDGLEIEVVGLVVGIHSPIYYR